MELTKSKAKRITLNTAIALGVTLTIPWLTHIIGGFLNLSDPTLLGRTFLPMHFGVFITGLLYGPIYGLVVGAVSPIISNILTGMPVSAPIPMMQLMIFELAAYGLVSGVLNQKLKIKNKEYAALIGAMIAGRFVAAVLRVTGLLAFGSGTFFAFMFGGLVTGYIGVIIQLAFIPFIIKRLNK